MDARHRGHSHLPRLKSTPCHQEPPEGRPFKSQPGEAPFLLALTRVQGNEVPRLHERDKRVEAEEETRRASRPWGRARPPTPDQDPWVS